MTFHAVLIAVAAVLTVSWIAAAALGVVLAREVWREKQWAAFVADHPELAVEP